MTTCQPAAPSHFPSCSSFRVPSPCSFIRESIEQFNLTEESELTREQFLDGIKSKMWEKKMTPAERRRKYEELRKGRNEEDLEAFVTKVIDRINKVDARAMFREKRKAQKQNIKEWTKDLLCIRWLFIEKPKAKPRPPPPGFAQMASGKSAMAAPQPVRTSRTAGISSSAVQPTIGTPRAGITPVSSRAVEVEITAVATDSPAGGRMRSSRPSKAQGPVARLRDEDGGASGSDAEHDSGAESPHGSRRDLVALEQAQAAQAAVGKDALQDLMSQMRNTGAVNPARRRLQQQEGMASAGSMSAGQGQLATTGSLQQPDSARHTAGTPSAFALEHAPSMGTPLADVGGRSGRSPSFLGSMHASGDQPAFGEQTFTTSFKSGWAGLIQVRGSAVARAGVSACSCRWRLLVTHRSDCL